MAANRLIAEELAAFTNNQKSSADKEAALKNDVLMSYQKQKEDEGVNSYS
jgi:hypothetical protein